MNTDVAADIQTAVKNMQFQMAAQVCFVSVPLPLMIIQHRVIISMNMCSNINFVEIQDTFL